MARPDADPAAHAVAVAQSDERPGRLDLTSSLYRDADGQSPVFAAVKAAEERLVARQASKADLPPGGDSAFHAALARQVLGADATIDRAGMLTTSGATGALRLGLEAVRHIRPEASVWIADPAAPRHGALASAAGLAARRYRYAEAGSDAVTGEAMLADLRHATAGDLILLQGCCHAPTGLDLAPDLWAALAALCLETGAVPVVDLAFPGFGLGFAKDCDGLQGLLLALPEAMLAVSCSHSFGLHGDRAGLLLVQAETDLVAGRVQAHLERLQTAMTGTPADHGPRVVTEILDGPDLSAEWEAELKRMRMRLGEVRATCATALGEATGEDRWSGLATGHGLFARLPLDTGQLRDLRETHGVHTAPEGRINVSALTDATLPTFAAAVAGALNITT